MNIDNILKSKNIYDSKDAAKILAKIYGQYGNEKQKRVAKNPAVMRKRIGRYLKKQNNLTKEIKPFNGFLISEIIRLKEAQAAAQAKKRAQTPPASPLTSPSKSRAVVPTPAEPSLPPPEKRPLAIYRRVNEDLSQIAAGFEEINSKLQSVLDEPAYPPPSLPPPDPYIDEYLRDELLNRQKEAKVAVKTGNPDDVLVQYVSEDERKKAERAAEAAKAEMLQELVELETMAALPPKIEGELSNQGLSEEIKSSLRELENIEGPTFDQGKLPPIPEADWSANFKQRVQEELEARRQAEAQPVTPPVTPPPSPPPDERAEEVDEEADEEADEGVVEEKPKLPLPTYEDFKKLVDEKSIELYGKKTLLRCYDDELKVTKEFLDDLIKDINEIDTPSGRIKFLKKMRALLRYISADAAAKGRLDREGRQANIEQRAQAQAKEDEAIRQAEARRQAEAQAAEAQAAEARRQAEAEAEQKRLAEEAAAEERRQAVAAAEAKRLAEERRKAKKAAAVARQQAEAAEERRQAKKAAAEAKRQAKKAAVEAKRQKEAEAAEAKRQAEAKRKADAAAAQEQRKEARKRWENSVAKKIWKEALGIIKNRLSKNFQFDMLKNDREIYNEWSYKVMIDDNISNCFEEWVKQVKEDQKIYPKPGETADAPKNPKLSTWSTSHDALEYLKSVIKEANENLETHWQRLYEAEQGMLTNWGWQRRKPEAKRADEAGRKAKAIERINDQILNIATRMAEAELKKDPDSDLWYWLNTVMKHETTPLYFGQWVEQAPTVKHISPEPAEIPNGPRDSRGVRHRLTNEISTLRGLILGAIQSYKAMRRLERERDRAAARERETAAFPTTTREKAEQNRNRALKNHDQRQLYSYDPFNEELAMLNLGLDIDSRTLINIYNDSKLQAKSMIEERNDIDAKYVYYFLKGLVMDDFLYYVAQIVYCTKKGGSTRAGGLCSLKDKLKKALNAEENIHPYPAVIFPNRDTLVKLPKSAVTMFREILFKNYNKYHSGGRSYSKMKGLEFDHSLLEGAINYTKKALGIQDGGSLRKRYNSKSKSAYKKKVRVNKKIARVNKKTRKKNKRKPLRSIHKKRTNRKNRTNRKRKTNRK
jgi:hypothetical protein